MPFCRRFWLGAELGKAVQRCGVSGILVSTNEAERSTSGVMSADWSPVEKGLNSVIGRLNGPLGRSTWPSGKIGPRQIAVSAIGERVLPGQRLRDRR